MAGPNLESSCPYEILGVDKNATLKHIKLSYRKLALIHHPDKLPPNASESEKKSSHKSFAAISNSYEILSDEGRRREYDDYESMQRDSQQQQYQQQQQHQQQQRGHHDDFFGGGMFGGSLFDDPFFASSFGRRRKRGSDSHAQFSDPFELFERFFEEELGHNRNSTGRDGSRSSSQRMDPFSDPFFSSMGGGFFGNASQMSSTGHFGMADSLMSQMPMFGNQQQQQHQFGSGNNGGHSSYSFSSSSTGFGGGQSSSTSTRTTIVNGVKQTVTERTVVHPDGRVERYVTSEGDSGRIASANHPSLESEGRKRRR